MIHHNDLEAALSCHGSVMANAVPKICVWILLSCEGKISVGVECVASQCKTHSMHVALTTVCAEREHCLQNYRLNLHKNIAYTCDMMTNYASKWCSVCMRDNVSVYLYDGKQKWISLHHHLNIVIGICWIIFFLTGTTHFKEINVTQRESKPWLECIWTNRAGDRICESKKSIHWIQRYKEKVSTPHVSFKNCCGLQRRG